MEGAAMLPRVHQDLDIPRFFLFGEAPQTVGDRYLHLEALSDRSRPNNWNIRAHAHPDLSHIFHIASGGGTMTAEDRLHAFAGPCALIVPAGAVHAFHFAPETEGTVLTISDHYLRELTLRDPVFGTLFAAAAVAPLPGDAVPASLGRLARELAWIAAGHVAAVEAHLLSILVECTRALERARSAETAKPGTQATLVARFRELVERHYRENLPLGRYVSLLGVTQAQLRVACLKVAGLPPTRIVRKRLLLEAKRALLYSNMTVAEAAYYLGFNDPAYFSRFFAQATGSSPRMFRSRAS